MDHGSGPNSAAIKNHPPPFDVSLSSSLCCGKKKLLGRLSSNSSDSGSELYGRRKKWVKNIFAPFDILDFVTVLEMIPGNISECSKHCFGEDTYYFYLYLEDYNYYIH